jgi:hypothetical protein
MDWKSIGMTATCFAVASAIGFGAVQLTGGSEGANAMPQAAVPAKAAEPERRVPVSAAEVWARAKENDLSSLDIEGFGGLGEQLWVFGIQLDYTVSGKIRSGISHFTVSFDGTDGDYMETWGKDGDDGDTLLIRKKYLNGLFTGSDGSEWRTVEGDTALDYDDTVLDEAFAAGELELRDEGYMVYLRGEALKAIIGQLHDEMAETSEFRYGIDVSRAVELLGEQAYVQVMFDKDFMPSSITIPTVAVENPGFSEGDPVQSCYFGVKLDLSAGDDKALVFPDDIAGQAVTIDEWSKR